MKLAILANALTLSAIVGVGAYQIEEAYAVERATSVSDEELHCLQQNIFFEARNQSVLGQTAVAWVTFNRVESTRYPNTICGVVWDDSQFSWTEDGRPDYPSDNVLEQEAWEQAGIVAEVALLDWARDRSGPIGDATMYHADYVDPYWSSAYDKVAQIDSHIFYE